MTVVYLDQYILLNLAVNFLLLSCAGKLSGGWASPGRCLLGAGLGTAFGVLALLPGWGWLEHPFCKAVGAALMILIAYGQGTQERMLRTGGLFLVLACAFGGGLLLLSMAGQGRGVSVGLLGSSLGMRGILMAAAVSYGALCLLLRGQFTHSRTGGELAPLTLTHRGKTLRLLALRDTGHSLVDPLTGRSVVIVEGERVRELVPEVFAAPHPLSDPVGLLGALEGRAAGVRLQLIPYRAVGVDHGLLLALRVDRAAWGHRTCRGCLMALSPTAVSDGGGYHALIGGDGI